MSRGGGGGGGGARQVFLSAHRCPEVDLLPQQLSEEKTSSPCEAGYLDICSTCRSDKDEDNDNNMSDWSEEDLLLHFSPSVILQSEDEESDPESGFECIDVTMATQWRGPKGAGPKMVPKRQIQLKKNVSDQVKHAPAEVGAANSDLSVVCPRSDLLLRQHSMPASLHLTSSNDVIGMVGGTIQGSVYGGRRLQKSLSLDETKTKQASSLIKSVLSKRMQVEKSSTHHLKSSPVLPQSSQQGGPVHQVRDVRSLLKTTPSPPVPTSSQVIGRKDSPPPTYQQATRAKGDVRRVTQSHSRKPHDTSQRRGSEPIRRGNGYDVTNMVSGPRMPANTSEHTGWNQSKCSAAPGPAGSPVSVPARPAACAHEQSSVLGVLPQETCFYATAPLPQLRTVSCVHGPLSRVPAHLPVPVLQNYEWLTETISGPPDRTSTSTGTRNGTETRTGTAGDQDGPRPSETTATLFQPHQHPLICSFQGFLPAQVGGDFGVDVTGSAATPGAAFGSAPHLMVDQKSQQCFYMELPPHPRVKMLLDPETGQFVQVVIPAAGSAPSSNLYPVGYAHPAPTVLSPTHTVMNPAPIILQVGGANHTMFSLMKLHPQMGLSSLYPLQHLAVMTSHPTHPNDVTPDTV